MSQAHGRRICLSPTLRAYPRSTIAAVGLPSCVTPSLDYYRIGSRAPLSPATPKGAREQFRAVSITGLVRVATLPVREYQPVVHRLRLSASP